MLGRMGRMGRICAALGVDGFGGQAPAVLALKRWGKKKKRKKEGKLEKE